MTDLTPEALRERCAFWQRELRLQDWDVKLSIARMGVLGDGTLGDVSPSTTKRQAHLRILDTRDVEGQSFWFDGEAWDWEVTLVHELLHLHLHDVVGQDYSTPQGLAAERAIHRISLALVALHRGQAPA